MTTTTTTPLQGMRAAVQSMEATRDRPVCTDCEDEPVSAHGQKCAACLALDQAEKPKERCHYCGEEIDAERGCDSWECRRASARDARADEAIDAAEAVYGEER